MGVFQNHLMAAAVAKAAESTDFYTYQIANSCRFDRASSAYLNRTIQSGGDLDKWTLSFWMKLTASAGFGSNQYHLYTSEDNASGAYDAILFDVNSSSQVYYQITNKYFTGNHSIRDTSAWYHVVFVFDSANGTAAHRKRVWFNNVEDTGSDVQTYPQNVDSQINKNTVHNIGARQDENAAYFFDGYLADFIFVDGQAYAPTYFGEEKNGVWIPKDYKTDTGEYGTTGYHLDFASSGDLGNDISGNNNDWTVHNIVASDQMKDSPTFDGTSNGGNFCTWNPLIKAANTQTFSEGNLIAEGQTSDEWSGALGTFMVTSGKWYFEGCSEENAVGSGDSNGWCGIGIANSGAIIDGSERTSTDVNFLIDNGWTRGKGGDDDHSASAWSADDILGVAYNADDGQVSFYINNSLVVTLTGSDVISGDVVPASLINDGGPNNHPIMNFGQDGTFNGRKTAQGNADGNGYGNFFYAPPSGFLAMCAGNLPTPTADPASEEGPENYFTNKLYTGDGASTLTISGLEFQPDFTVIKNRDQTDSWCYFDSSRGVTKLLSSDTTAAESTDADTLKSWTSDGYTVGADDKVNTSTEKYVSWNWKLNGGTTASNTTGSHDCVVQVDTDRGISIMTMADPGGAVTVGHGLGVAPSMYILKARSGTSSWGVYHKGIGATKYLKLQDNSAAGTSSSWFNDTEPTTSVLSLGSTWNGAGTMVAYAFVEKEGFSKFGSYEGNGNANGPFVYTGFTPAMVIWKSADGARNWITIGNKRETYNQRGTKTLVPDTSDAEYDTAGGAVDFLSNGWKVRGSDDKVNQSGETYIYLAFAENPFKYTVAR